MLASHILDCRPGISGLKFSSFVHLGVEAWDTAVTPYLKSKDDGGNSENRIKEVSLPTLLKYCALDSLLEFKMSELQMKKLGMEIEKC